MGATRRLPAPTPTPDRVAHAQSAAPADRDKHTKLKRTLDTSREGDESEVKRRPGFEIVRVNSYDILVDLDTEGLRDLLRDAHPTERRVARGSFFF